MGIGFIELGINVEPGDRKLVPKYEKFTELE